MLRGVSTPVRILININDIQHASLILLIILIIDWRLFLKRN